MKRVPLDLAREALRRAHEGDFQDLGDGTMDALEIARWISQAGFAGIAVWLILDTRKESAERERSGLARERELMAVVSSQAASLSDVARTLDRIDQRLAAKL